MQLSAEPPYTEEEEGGGPAAGGAPQPVELLRRQRAARLLRQPGTTVRPERLSLTRSLFTGCSNSLRT